MITNANCNLLSTSCGCDSALYEKACSHADPTVIKFLEISGLVQSTEGGSDSLSWSTIFGIPVARTFRVGCFTSEQGLPRGDFEHECTGRLHGSGPESEKRSRDRSVSPGVQRRCMQRGLRTLGGWLLNIYFAVDAPVHVHALYPQSGGVVHRHVDLNYYKSPHRRFLPRGRQLYILTVQRREEMQILNMSFAAHWRWPPSIGGNRVQRTLEFGRLP